MIKIVRKTSAPQYQDVNDLGLHPTTVILCNGFGVNPITKALHMKFVQVHNEQNPHLHELGTSDTLVDICGFFTRVLDFL